VDAMDQVTDTHILGKVKCIPRSSAESNPSSLEISTGAKPMFNPKRYLITIKGYQLSLE
jgi:hypothetical protein